MKTMTDRDLLEQAAKALEQFRGVSVCVEDGYLRVFGLGNGAAIEHARELDRELRARLSTPAAEVLQATRPETGPMRFGDDWTGVFIRGDNAFYYAHMLRRVLDGTADPKVHVLECAPLHSLVEDLAGSNDTAGRDRDGVQQLRPFAECLSTPAAPVHVPDAEGLARIVLDEYETPAEVGNESWTKRAALAVARACLAPIVEARRVYEAARRRRDDTFDHPTTTEVERLDADRGMASALDALLSTIDSLAGRT